MPKYGSGDWPSTVIEPQWTIKCITKTSILQLGPVPPEISRICLGLHFSGPACGIVPWVTRAARRGCRSCAPVPPFVKTSKTIWDAFEPPVAWQGAQLPARMGWMSWL